MTNAEKEFWLQFAGSIVRKLLAMAGAFLVTHGWITTDQSDTLTTQAIVEFAVSFLLIFGASLWSWAKVKFNIGVVREARAAAPETPISEITKETLDKQNFISSV